MSLYQAKRYPQPHRVRPALDREQRQRINKVIATLENLRVSTPFTQSVVQQFRASDWLSENQITALERNVPKEAPAKTKLPVIDMEPVYALFTTASQHLKFPKIRLLIGQDSIVLYRTGDKSRFPNAVAVKTEDGEEFYGWVTQDGTWHEHRDPVPETVRQTVIRFALDPVGVSRNYGRLLGRCCFCGLKLEDERSTQEGYGPVCADHYGLPWGTRRR